MATKYQHYQNGAIQNNLLPYGTSLHPPKSHHMIIEWKLPLKLHILQNNIIRLPSYHHLVFIVSSKIS